MPKKHTTESDEVRLKNKIAERLAKPSHPEGDAAMRSLRKRLKREQRKRRAVAMRKKHAGAKQAEAPAPAAG
jgi:ribosomal protein L18E